VNKGSPSGCLCISKTPPQSSKVGMQSAQLQFGEIRETGDEGGDFILVRR